MRSFSAMAVAIGIRMTEYGIATLRSLHRRTRRNDEKKEVFLYFLLTEEAGLVFEGAAFLVNHDLG